MTDWIYVNDKERYCIIVFDDGIDPIDYIDDPSMNDWYSIATNNKGKLKLKNYKDSSIIISSISKWKVNKLVDK